MLKTIIYFIIIIIVNGCIEPYEVGISKFQNLLVVDALITDENKSHRVTLKRSTNNIDEKSIPETRALIKIIDEEKNETILAEILPGYYLTDSTKFIAEVGKTYLLEIQTTNGEIYQSTPCKMLPSTQINNIYFKKDKQWDIDEVNENEGIGIYINGMGAKGTYLRWTYEEAWKFKVPYAPTHEYIGNNELISVSPKNVFCWKENKSNIIYIYSIGDQISSEINERKIQFIPTELTDKISVRYSILVKQMTISKDEYEFWNKLKESSEDVGDVFGKQPFSVPGNISNIKNSKEPVLGYFQVCSVTSKRLFIDIDEIKDLNIPLYNMFDHCNIETYVIDGLAFFTIDEIYEKLVLNGPYELFTPKYGFIDVVGLVLSYPRCTDCTATGTNKKPEFWVD